MDARIARNLLSMMAGQIDQANALLEAAHALQAIANASDERQASTPSGKPLVADTSCAFL